jgi:hypothetical protein
MKVQLNVKTSISKLIMGFDPIQNSSSESPD